MYTIEKGIEPPKTTRVKPPKYPFAEMQDGDSFLVEDIDSKRAQSIRTTGYRYTDMKIKVAPEGTGYRFWTMAKKDATDQDQGSLQEPQTNESFNQ